MVAKLRLGGVTLGLGCNIDMNGFKKFFIIFYQVFECT